MRRGLYALQVLLLGTIVSATVAVTSCATSGVFGIKDPIVCGIWGALLGFPATALFVYRMSNKD